MCVVSELRCCWRNCIHSLIDCTRDSIEIALSLPILSIDCVHLPFSLDCLYTQAHTYTKYLLFTHFSIGLCQLLFCAFGSYVTYVDYVSVSFSINFKIHQSPVFLPPPKIGLLARILAYHFHWHLILICNVRV